MEDFENKMNNENNGEQVQPPEQPQSSADETVSQPDYNAAVSGPERVDSPVYSDNASDFGPGANAQPDASASQNGGTQYSYNYTASQGTQNPPQDSYSYAYSYDQPPQQPPKKKKEKKPRKPLGKRGKIALAILAVFVIGLGGGMLGTLITRSVSGRTGSVVMYQSATTDNKKDTDSTGSTISSNSAESVASDTAASVVEVTTSYVQTNSFFGNYVTSGAGSGVIISKDGYIATNNHVIENAKSITVTLKSGKEYKATKIGTDEKTDIAVLKINATGLTPVVLGDSSKIAVGESIIVVGNPLGKLGGSVTQGIISAKDREVKVENETMTLIQIDAAVNPGNSGGALFNLKGELVGIVNAKYSSEEVEGLGFAVPVNTAKSTIKDIIEYGYVKGRAQLGITAVEISDLQTALSAGVNELGVYVYSVNSGSGADKAGLQAGDRIISVDGKEISTYSGLSKILDNHSVGDTVTLRISRSSQEKTVKVKLIEYNPNTSTTKSSSSSSSSSQTTTSQSSSNNPYSYYYSYGN